MFGKELIRNFVKNNFDMSAFNCKWHNDMHLELTDKTGSKIDILTLAPDRIYTLINEEPFLNYKLVNGNFIIRSK